MALLNEARRHATPPEERIDVAIEGWIRGVRASHRRDPTQAEIDERKGKMLALMRQEADTFFSQYRNLADAFSYEPSAERVAEVPVGPPT